MFAQVASLLLVGALAAPSGTPSLEASPRAGLATGVGVEEGCDQRCRGDLERARDATEKYWDVAVATNEGFVELPGCMSSQGGATGVEFAHLGRTLDKAVSVEQPESLLYMPEGTGGSRREGAGRRLVAVEYRVPVLDDAPQPPQLFGRPFDGPVPGDTAGLPEYRLRVWLFSANPVGLFAEANPTETCIGAGLVAPQAFEESLFEVAGVFSVEAAKVREVLGIPLELRLRGEGTDGGGQTEVVVSARSFLWSSEGQLAESTNFAASWVNLQPPDWSGADLSFDRASHTGYPFFMLSDNIEAVEWMQRGLGVGSEVVAHTDDIMVEAPSGAVGPYRFSSPNFILEGSVTDAAPANTTFSWRFWHEGPRGMGLFRGWHDDMQLGAADFAVTPMPGTALSELLGCEPGAEVCAPVRPSVGAVILATTRTPWRATVSREWWSPRL